MTAEDEAPESRPRHILLVEDDRSVRGTFRAILQDEGYRVEEATTGAEAVAAFERECPDLLLSDLVLPPPNGEELARLCRACCPDTVLVLMSGYSELELHDLDIKQVVFLPKPMQGDKLRETIARLLG